MWDEKFKLSPPLPLMFNGSSILLKRQFFPQLNCFHTFVKNWLSTFLLVYFWLLDFVPLICVYWSVWLAPCKMPSNFHDYNYIASLLCLGVCIVYLCIRVCMCICVYRPEVGIECHFQVPSLTIFVAGLSLNAGFTYLARVAGQQVSETHLSLAFPVLGWQTRATAAPGFVGDDRFWIQIFMLVSTLVTEPFHQPALGKS